MKRFAILFLAAALSITSCKKENNTPDLIDSNFMPSASDSLIAQGNFQSEVHPTSGTVELYKNESKYTLRFENFKTDNGPDLRVYLSLRKNTSSAIPLGALKAVNGNFEYTFDVSSEVANNKNVIIWCEDFSVLFGSAALQ